MKHNHKSQDALGITNNRCIGVRKSMYRHPQKNPRFPPGGVLKSAYYGYL